MSWDLYELLKLTLPIHVQTVMFFLKNIMAFLPVHLFVLTLLASCGSGRRFERRDNQIPGKRDAPPLCGASNPNNNVIDQSEPDLPGPFHDLTVHELTQLRLFLETDPDIRLSNPESAFLNTSFLYTADLLVPPKKEVLKFLDQPGSPQPARKARVVVLRGDKSPPMVEEYVCYPLPDVEKCELLVLPSRRNPVDFSFRPMTEPEFKAIDDLIIPEIDRQVGYILQESYGETFTDCEDDKDCLSFYPSMFGSELIKDPSKRLNWLNAIYDLPFATMHLLDFGVLLESSSPNPADWSIVKIWYANRIFETFDDLIQTYNSGNLNKTRVQKPVNDHNLFSSLQQRGDFVPAQPQRPPTLVEPDGKRYSVKGKKVEYLGWSFNFRLSSLTGPAVYDVRYKGQRVAYEVALSEVAVFYSGYSPFGQTTNYVDSSELLGSQSRSMVPGGDCPETATLLNTTFLTHSKREPEVVKAALCLFENNNGYPLRRHLSYELGSGSFYGGMLDSVLVLRSALTIGNYDYIVDVMFHQNAVIEARLMSTGYIQSVFYSETESQYGFQIHKNLLGNVHHHLAHFKVDIDIKGTSNRYQTLDIHRQRVNLTAFPDRPYSQTTFERTVKQTELDAVYDYDFQTPKYHIIHNEAEKTDLNEIKGFRIQMDGMSKNLVADDQGNEKSASWGRHQMVVTKQKDDEVSSSSLYGMYDSSIPTVNFTAFYGDDENIVDEDLVLWITSGMHHIPHTEDLPVTPTVGNHLSFFLLPYNYFTECPSMGSRDAIYVEHKNINSPELGVKVERYGQSRDQCVIPKSTLEEDVAEDPERILQSFKTF